MSGVIETLAWPRHSWTILGCSPAASTAIAAPPHTRARDAPHAPLAPELLPRVARAAGVEVCLFDTAIKDGRGLLEWLTPESLTSLVAEAHDAGLEIALAGALRAEDLAVVRDAGADIAGVRSAACGGGDRSRRLDAARVRSLVAACGISRAPAR